MNCKTCNKDLKGKQTKFCSRKCQNRDTNTRFQTYNAQQERGLSRKRTLVQRRGGSCEVCGYKKNLSSLVFHHVNPKEKNFNLDMRVLSNNSIETIEEEFNKCVLMCHNCHNEHHHPELSIN